MNPRRGMRTASWLRCIVPILSCSVLLGSVGCLGGNDGLSPDHAALQPSYLESTVLSRSAEIGIPARIQIADDVLWVADARGDPGLFAVDASTGQVLQGFWRQGQGPDEFSSKSPFALVLDPTDLRAVWAFDSSAQRLVRMEPRPVSEFEMRSVQLQGTPRPPRLARVGEERFIGVAASVDARFSLFTADGARVGVAPGTLFGPEDAPDRWRWAATNGAITACSWPGRGFVIAYHGFGRLEFYDDDAQLIRLAEVPFPSDPVFDSDGRFQLRAGYLDCTATVDRVYALFPGENSADDSSADGLQDIRSASGKFLHAFDWQGELRAVFELDRDIGAVTVDSTGETLYGGSFTDSGLYRYALPSES